MNPLLRWTGASESGPLDKVPRPTLSLLLLMLTVMAASCAPDASQYTSRAASPGMDQAVAVSSGPSTTPAVSGVQKISYSDTSQLEKLWHKRTQDIRLTDYPIGTGDVIEISVPAIEALQQRSVRVSAEGTIALPLVGVVKAGGLTEEQFRQVLVRKLHKYMYHPEVDVFVKTYRSRQVEVIGAVKQPGLVTLTSPTETILDVIGQAGGITTKAADQILLFPADRASQHPGSPATNDPLRNSQDIRRASLSSGAVDGPTAGGSRSKGGAREDYMSLAASGRQALVIGLQTTSLTGAGRYLHMPVRPGDVILVPGGGDVMVIGWVANPGHFKVGSGLTVLGAIGAAGGPMFAANTSNVRLIRTGLNGQKEVMTIDVSRIMTGNAPDIPVKANDVIDVPYSNAKIGPYVFYSILSKVGYGIGLGGTIP